MTLAETVPTRARRKKDRAARLAWGSLAAASIAGMSAIAIGQFTFRRQISNEVAALFDRSSGDSSSPLSEADLAGLPEPVQRWLRYSRVVGKDRPSTVRLKMDGTFRLGADQAWMRFEAQEYYTTDPPGYIWPVSMRVAPLLSITGRDAYFEGRGSIQMRLLSLIPVASSRGPNLDQGALLRYLNETMWFPAAVVSPYITWDAIDTTSARATMSYEGVSASAIFYFDSEGRLTDMVAERYNDSLGRLETWSTPISAYGEFHGVRVPTAGVALWKLSDGDFAYIDLRVTAIEYNRPEQW